MAIEFRCCQVGLGLKDLTTVLPTPGTGMSVEGRRLCGRRVDDFIVECLSLDLIFLTLFLLDNFGDRFFFGFSAFDGSGIINRLVPLSEFPLRLSIDALNLAERVSCLGRPSLLLFPPPVRSINDGLLCFCRKKGDDFASWLMSLWSAPSDGGSGGCTPSTVAAEEFVLLFLLVFHWNNTSKMLRRGPLVCPGDVSSALVPSFVSLSESLGIRAKRSLARLRFSESVYLRNRCREWKETKLRRDKIDAELPLLEDALEVVSKAAAALEEFEDFCWE
mmetsp:Transcript_19268/g.40409  ORF Transcript_19268/g.40409 Transcript_19268/m.40409 type:complete len:276 (+) Transcript_19268:2111-2938(+)